MAISNGDTPQFENRIMALDALRKVDKLFTLHQLKSLLIPEEQCSQIGDEKCGKSRDSIFFSVMSMSPLMVSILKRSD